MDFIELDGVGLRYELSGKGDRALVLVHEMGGSLESWDDIAPRFADSRRVLRYCFFGASSGDELVWAPAFAGWPAVCFAGGEPACVPASEDVPLA